MALSSRASAFLAGFSHKPHVASRSTMESIFESVNIPLYAPILAFQQDYAGYRLMTDHTLFPGLTCGIVQHKPKPISRNPISRMLQLVKLRIKRHYNDYRVEDYHFHAMRYENKWFFGCTEDTFEGITYIDEEGKLWHSIWNFSGKYEAPWLRASSMDKYIERVAFWKIACLSDQGG